MQFPSHVKVGIYWARSIQPKFQPVRPGKEDHLKRWTHFSKLFRLDRTDPLSFGPKFPEILVEWIAPTVSVPVLPYTQDVTNTGNGERGTGTGVWELMYSGNPLENSRWRTKQKKRLEETIWVNASFYRLCPQMANAFL